MIAERQSFLGKLAEMANKGDLQQDFGRPLMMSPVSPRMKIEEEAASSRMASLIAPGIEKQDFVRLMESDPSKALQLLERAQGMKLPDFPIM